MGGGKVGLRAGLKFWGRENNGLPLPALEPRIVQPVTSHYNDCATPASITLHSEIKWASVKLHLRNYLYYYRPNFRVRFGAQDNITD
jgi:hypothetical protein